MSNISAEYIAIAILFSVLTAVVMWLFQRKQLQVAQLLFQESKEQGRDFETEMHRKDREHSEERNRLEIEYHDKARTLRAHAFEEGRQLGLAEGQREHVNELTAQQHTFAQTLLTERDAAAQEARDRTRAELEMQAKLYDVSVRPYLKVDKVKGIFKDEEQVEAGYQYQLLVNGIPAFQPSVVIEETRRSSKVNEENFMALLQVAERAAKAAAELYLGAGASVAKLGPAIIKRITK